MFHILSEGCSVLKTWPEELATKILCDVKTPRDAITSKRFNKLVADGKLNEDRCCKACYRRATGGSRLGSSSKESSTSQ